MGTWASRDTSYSLLQDLVFCGSATGPLRALAGQMKAVNAKVQAPERCCDPYTADEGNLAPP